MVSKCSICQKPVARRAENPAFPFCSPRCKAVDLGKWLGEEYRVVSEADEAPLATPPDTAPTEDA